MTDIWRSRHRRPETTPRIELPIATRASRDREPPSAAPARHLPASNELRVLGENVSIARLAEQFLESVGGQPRLALQDLR